MSNEKQFSIPKYRTIVQLQETTDGEYCYIAFHPELPNVISQGETPDEARENLVEATELTIFHLTSNNLPIPEAKPFKPTTIKDTSIEYSELRLNTSHTPDSPSGELHSIESPPPSNKHDENKILPTGQWAC